MQKEENASIQHVKVVDEEEIVVKEEIVITQDEESIVAQIKVDVLKKMNHQC